VFPAKLVIISIIYIIYWVQVSCAFEISAISLEKFSSKVKNSDVKIKGQTKMADETGLCLN
jgi:hypothetical protein